MARGILIPVVVFLLSGQSVMAQSDSLLYSFRLAYEHNNRTEFLSARNNFQQLSAAPVLSDKELEELIIVSRYFRDIPFTSTLLDLQHTLTHPAGSACNCGKHAHCHEN